MSSVSSDIMHHFFKVYLPSHCFHNLKIPQTFVQKMNRVVPGVAILRDPFERSWHVEVEKVEDTFYFQTGWREFVEANFLNVGDFMVFRFMGNSVFNVMIFDNSGCEKEDNLEEEEEEDEEEYDFSSATAAFDEPMNPYFITSLKEKRPYHLHVPKSVVTENDIALKPRMILLDPNQIKWPIRVCFRKDGRIIFTKGWWDFWTGNNLTPHDKCIFEFEQDEESKVIKVNIVRRARWGEVTLVPRGGR